MKRVLELVSEDKLSIVNKDWYLRINIDWNDIKNKVDLFNALKKYVNFPDYFWENWDAFWDIITDKDFIDFDIQICISNFDNLFTYRDEKNIFLGILIDWLNCDYCRYNIEVCLIKER
jgi:RNAse (barnase) inhibitor barstar